MKKENMWEILKNFILKDDKIFNIDQVKTFLRTFSGDLTFKDVYEKNGWILNVNVTSHRLNQARLCNYISTPDVIIWSAVIASCSITEFYGVQELLIKNKKGQIVPYHGEDKEGIYGYVDGSFSYDLPVDRIG